MKRFAMDRTGSEGHAPRRLGLLAAVAASLVIAPQAIGEVPQPDVMRVEEDWEVQLNDPHQLLKAPQFHTVISPVGDTESYYYQACWNYREMPDLTSGGLQVLVFHGDTSVGSKSIRSDSLSTSAETITWSQSIQTNGNMLRFSITNGNSQTWGSFGGSEASLQGAAPVVNLNEYDPNVSAENSWISYGANRVNLMRINEVRYYDAQNNLIRRDATVRVVYQHQD